MPSPFPCSPVIREYSLKKTHIEKKKKKCAQGSREAASKGLKVLNTCFCILYLTIPISCYNHLQNI